MLVSSSPGSRTTFRGLPVDWSKLPAILAVGLLASAFASVARTNYTRTSGLWLTAWLLILLHFTSFVFLPAPGLWGLAAGMVGVSALLWAGILFMWAAVPYRTEPAGGWMLLVLLSTNTIYVCAAVDGATPWVLNIAALLLGAGPLVVALAGIPRFTHPLRWVTV